MKINPQGRHKPDRRSRTEERPASVGPPDRATSSAIVFSSRHRSLGVRLGMFRGASRHHTIKLHDQESQVPTSNLLVTNTYRCRFDAKPIGALTIFLEAI